MSAEGEDIYDRATGKSKYTGMTAAEERAYLVRKRNPKFARARKRAEERNRQIRKLQAQERAEKSKLNQLLKRLKA